jgi:hypothetical protein
MLEFAITKNLPRGQSLCTRRGYRACSACLYGEPSGVWDALEAVTTHSPDPGTSVIASLQQSPSLTVRSFAGARLFGSLVRASVASLREHRDALAQRPTNVALPG